MVSEKRLVKKVSPLKKLYDTFSSSSSDDSSSEECANEVKKIHSFNTALSIWMLILCFVFDWRNRHSTINAIQSYSAFWWVRAVQAHTVAST